MNYLSWWIVFLFSFFGLFSMWMWYLEWREHSQLVDEYRRMKNVYSSEIDYLNGVRNGYYEELEHLRPFPEKYMMLIDALNQLAKESDDMKDLIQPFLQLVRLSSHWSDWTIQQREAFIARYTSQVPDLPK